MTLASDAEAWESVKMQWRVALNRLTAERTLAVDARDQSILAAERNAFMQWLKVREASLRLLYPEHPEIVNEVIAQTIRARVIDLCAEAK